MSALALCIATGGACSKGEDGLKLSFSPATLVASHFQGESTRFTVEATLSESLDGAIYVVIVDAEGILDEGSLTLSSISATRFTAFFGTSRSLPAGPHRGALQVNLCRDATCQNTVAGGPWPLAYDITVKGFYLQPLAPLPGVSDWLTDRGDAAHSGYVPAAFDPTSIARRWWVDPRPTDWPTGMSEIAVDAGRVFISLNPAAFPTTERPRVRAISETTGRVLWTYTATGSSVLFPPAASVGAVHVVRSDALVILDAATGGVLAETPAPTEIRLEGRATPTGGLVFVPCETTSTHRNCDAIFDATSGTFLRTVERSSNWLSYNPSVLAGDLLLSLEYQRIRAFHPADGTLAWEYANPSIASLPTSLVVSKPEGFVCTTTQVVCIDTTTREATSFTLPYKSRIVAFVKGVVYSARSDNPGSASPNVLDAYDFQTGALLWSWTSTPGTFDRDVIVTDNLLFISAGGTVAVDLTTHETVWRDSIGGALALSGTGVLYVLREISSDSTSLVAYNLSALPSP